MTASPLAEWIAAQAAARLAADIDPSFPRRIDRLCSLSRKGLPTDDDPDASFLLALAGEAATLAPQALSQRNLEGRLRRDFGLDEGLATDLERILDAVVVVVIEEIVDGAIHPDRGPGT